MGSFRVESAYAFIPSASAWYGLSHWERGISVSNHSVKHIVRHDQRVQSRTDGAVVDALTDEQINYSDIPPLSESYAGPIMIVQPRGSKRSHLRHV